MFTARSRVTRPLAWLIPLTLLLFLLAGCDQGSAGEEDVPVASGYIEYIGSTFALQVPTTWRQAATPEFEAVFGAPVEEDFSANLGVSVSLVSESATLIDVAETARSFQEQSYSNYQVVQEGPFALGDGTAAYRRVYTWVDDDFNLPIKQMQLFVQEGTAVYTVTATSLEHLYDKYSPTFEQMITTLNVTP